jgi:hypothetical protein
LQRWGGSYCRVAVKLSNGDGGEEDLSVAAKCSRKEEAVEAATGRYL